MIPGSEETTSSHIPLDIVEKILLKLPLKSIIRSRSVCKAWGDLSKSSSFVASHAKESGHHCVVDVLYSQNCTRDSRAHETCEECSPEVVLYSKTLSSKNGRLISNHQLLSNHALESTPRLFIRKKSRRRQRIFKAVGNCNGIVCITNFVHIYLINPSLNEMKKISAPQMDANSWWRLIGLGFDESSNNFKVVTVPSYWNQLGERVKDQRGQYNLSTNSWSVVGKIPWTTQVSGKDSTPVFVNGVIHWCVHSGYYDDYCIKVLTFNTTTELFQLLNLPRLERERQNVRLFVLNQKLLVFASTDLFDTNQFVNIWVMKDYGVEESWTKLYSIRPPPYVRKPIEPVSFWEEDKVFLKKTDENLVLYDMLQGRASGSIDLSRNRLSGHHYSVGCRVCKESLISLSSIF